MSEKSAKKRGLIVVPDRMPLPPKDQSLKRWSDCQLALKAAGVPLNIIYRITTLRAMNMWTAMVIVRQHPWQQIADWEHELMKKSVRKNPLMK